MASKYSKIKNGAIFDARGGKFRKVDELYYEDLNTGFQAVWNPVFDASIAGQADPEPGSTGEVNTTDKYLVDAMTRVMKPNPDYKETNAIKALGEMWGSAEYDCGPDDYNFIVSKSVAAVLSMKALAQIVGVPDDILVYPDIIDVLAAAFEDYKVRLFEASKPKKTPTKKTAAKKSPKKAVKKTAGKKGRNGK